ncbi:MAG: hypothetical protein NTZ33_15420 [Bacteroidetes bacterium]|nr:hypothetical protein [Bacteroidota bacterium]
MKKIIFLVSLILLLSFCYVNNNLRKYLIVEKYIIKYGKEKRVFVKYFDSINNILLYKEGNINITDSTIYNYDYKLRNVEIINYLPNESGELILNSTNNMNIDKITKNSFLPFYTDTFGLYDENNFKEIEINYKKNLKITSQIIDSELVYKLKYFVNSKVFIVLPFTNNNRGVDESEILDSLILYCHNLRIYKEDYFFRKKTITKKYSYEDDRLTKVKTKVNSTFVKDSLIETFKYRLSDLPYK